MRPDTSHRPAPPTDWLAISRKLEADLVAARARVDELAAERRKFALDALLGDEVARANLDEVDVALLQCRRAVQDLEDARPELLRRMEAEQELRRREGQRQEREQHAIGAAVRRKEAEAHIRNLERSGQTSQAQVWRDHLAHHPDYRIDVSEAPA